MGRTEGEDMQMNRSSSMATLIVTAILSSTCGCGDPAVGTLKAINMTVSHGAYPNLVGQGGTLQLTATGIYTSSDTRDVSNRVTYVALGQGTDLAGAALPPPPQTLTVSPTGLVTA